MKKLFSMLLVVAMLLSSFGVTSFAEGTVTIGGVNKIYKTPNSGETVYTSFPALLDGEKADFVYSIEGDTAGLSIDSATGELAVTPDAFGTVTIKATLADDETVSVSKDVPIVDAVNIDFTGSGNLDYFWSGGKVADDSDGNRYFTVGTGSGVYSKFTMADSGYPDALTIEVDVKFSEEKYKHFIITGDKENSGAHWAYISTKNINSTDSTVEVVFNEDEVSLGTYNLNQWYSLKIIVDVDGNNIKLYMNDILVGETTCETLSGSTVLVNPYVNAMLVNAPVDNIKIYNGITKNLQSSGVVEITGADTIYKTPYDGETTYVGGYSATLNGADAPFTYSLKENYTDVSVDAQSGKLAVGYNAPESVTLVASYKNNVEIKAEKTVSISAAYTVDFSDTADQDIFDDWCWDTKKYGTVTSGGYVNVNNDLYTKNDFCPVAPAGTDSFTVEFDMLLTSSNLDDGEWKNGFNLRGMSSNMSGVWETFELTAYDETTNKVTLTSLAGLLGDYDNGTWATIKVAVNDTEGYYDIYVNGEYKIRKQYSGVNYYLVSLRFWKNVNFDNVKVYNGIAKASISADIDNIYIPVDGKSANAHLSISGADDEAVTWSLANEYTGVSVNANTGVVTVTSEAAEGTVIVNATNVSDMNLGSYALNLKKAQFDGATAAGFTDATVSTYGGETVLYAKWNNLYYQFAKDELKGKFVAEGTFLATDGKSLAISSSMHGQSSWITWAPEYTTNSWIDFKAIFDTEAKTVTSILDGKIYNKADMDFIMNDPSADVSISSIIITCTYLKDFKLYTVGDNTPPEIYGLKASTVEYGKPLAATYTYVSESGLPESCSIITWYKNSGAEGAWESVETPYSPTVTDVGRSFKVVVQPASGDLKGAEYESEPVELKKPWEFTTEYITVTNGDDTTNKLVAGGVISSVTITKTLADTGAGAYVALYNISGTPELEAISTVSIPDDISVGSSVELNLTDKITLPSDVTNYVAKVFVLNNELTPLAKPYECDGKQRQLIVMGDSIFHDYHLDEDDTGAMTGVGEVIGDYLTDNVTVVNRAYSGHTTEKYLNYTTFEETGYDEMFTWAQIKPLINEGDMIIVTLGINDEGKQIPYNDYMENLGTFVTEARALGAQVIIGTPTLTVWGDDMIEKAYDARANKAIEAAITYDAPYVDTNTAAYNEFIKNGNDADVVTAVRESYYLHAGVEGYEDEPDYCHLSEGGARFYAELIARLVNITDSWLANYIKVN